MEQAIRTAILHECLSGRPTVRRYEGVDMVSSVVMTQQPAHGDTAGRRFLNFIATGDSRVLDALLAEHLDLAYCQARRFLGNGSEAEDAVQEAIVNLVRNAGRYNGTVPFGAWLGCLVHNAALTALRARGRRRRHEKIAGSQQTDSELGVALINDDSEAVRDAVRELPEQYRATIDLHYFAGLSQRDTATALGIKENAVAKRLERARDVLRSLLLRRGVTVTGVAIIAALVESPAHAAPATLTTGALIKQATSLAAHAAKASALGWPAKVAVASVASGALAVGASLAANSAHAPTAAATTVEHNWNFNDRRARGIDVLRGEWKSVVNDGTDHSGCMETTSEGFIADLDITAQTLPLKVSFKTAGISPNSRGGFIQKVGWSDTGFAEFKGAGSIYGTYKGQWVNFEIYVTERSIDIYSNGQRTNLFYSKPDASARLQLVLAGYLRIDDLRVVSVQPEKVPPVDTYMSALESIPEAQRVGTVDLPSLGKSVRFVAVAGPTAITHQSSSSGSVEGSSPKAATPP
jgi:RNA polymerase sigma factor (sigma-70 family)